MKRLYAGGDLSQNLRLRDGDYIYIASVIGKECYVFGAVGGGESGGVIPLGQHQTVIGAIAAAGGYSRNAWKNKVLIVRGSLAEPELIEVKDGRYHCGKNERCPPPGWRYRLRARKAMGACDRSSRCGVASVHHRFHFTRPRRRNFCRPLI